MKIMNTDDALAETKSNTIICSIENKRSEKQSFRIIIYNFAKKKWMKYLLYMEIVLPLSTSFNWRQDKDNLIRSYRNWSEKAAKYLEGCYTEQEMFDTVNEMYQDKHQLT